MKPILHLFDDREARSWAPFSLTRPAGELLLGCLTLRERAERFWGVRCSGHLCDPKLAGFAEEGSPPVLDSDGMAGRGEESLRIFLSSRAVCGPAAAPDLAHPATVVVGGEAAGWILPPGSPAPPREDFLDPGRARALESTVAVDGVVARRPWDLVANNAEWVGRDIPAFFAASPGPLPEGVISLGREPLSVGEGVEIEPGSVLDLRAGPIRLDDGVRVRAHTYLAGPSFIGKGSLLLGGDLSGVSIGPSCKVRGEVEESVLLGFSNKAHDGYLGHSYLGRWVNLGALTTTSDLKNNYSTVRVVTPGGEEDTGALKVGSFFGDHVKTGIGTLLGAGTIIGAGSNLFGESIPRKFVPPFSWGSGTDLTRFRLAEFLEAAERVVARRGQSLTEGMRTLLARAWEDSRGEESARD